MSQYRTGTASVTNGSNVITGTGTAWLSNVAVDDWFIGQDKIKYNVSAVNSDTEIEISVNYGGSTVEFAYTIHRDFLDGKPVFSDGDVETATIINAWVSTTGTVDQIQDIADALAAQLSEGQTQADFESVREANRRKFAGSGHVEYGKQVTSGAATMINHGLWARVDTPNTLFIGRADSVKEGTSLTDLPVVNADGVLLDVSGIGANPTLFNEMTLPPAPDGLDKSDGTGRFTDLAAAIAAGGTALNASVINREDLIGYEVFAEAIETNDVVFPRGIIQNGETTYEGITLSDSVVVQGYFAFGEWDTVTTGYGLKWSTASDAERNTFINRKENNIYRDAETGKLIQWRLRARSIAGLGAKWLNAVTTNSLGYLTFASGFGVEPRGQKTTVADYRYGSAFALYASKEAGISDGVNYESGVFTVRAAADGSINTDYAHNGECYFIPIATVGRLNTGGYHRTLNKFGSSRYWSSDGVTTQNRVWYESDINKPVTISDCFRFGSPYVSDRGYIASGLSGREDGKFYDAIYEGDVTDLRLSARRSSDADLVVSKLAAGIANELRGAEGTESVELVSTVIEAHGDLLTSAFSTSVDIPAGEFVIGFCGDNAFYGYSTTASSPSTIYLALSRALAFANSPAGVSFQRTQGATTTIYKVTPSELQHKEILHCDIIGDPANYYSGQTYTNTGVAIGISGLVIGEVVFNNDGNDVNGLNGHYYRTLVAQVGDGIQAWDYSNTTNFADLGTTYNGQTWTNDGAPQNVLVNTGDVVFNNDGNDVNGLSGHFYKRVPASGTVTLGGTDYANPLSWTDLGLSYRGQQWTTDGAAQVVTVGQDDVIFLAVEGGNTNGTVGNYYRHNLSAVALDLNGLDLSSARFTDLGSEWNESPAAGSWLQDGIAGNPKLTHSDTGANLIPDASVKSFKMSRKVSESVLTLFSADNGVTWGVSTVWKAPLESAANGRTISAATGTVYMFFYTTDAHVGEPASNAVVDMLGDVWGGSLADKGFGVEIASALLNKVLTNTSSGWAGSASLTNYLVRPDNGKLNTTEGEPTVHNQLVLANPNASPAVKLLPYISHENGRKYLYLLFKEMFWDTSKDVTGEFTSITDTTTTMTAKESYFVTNGNFVGYWKWHSTIAVPLNSAAYFEKDGRLYWEKNSGSIAERWNGTGWGDDNKFDVIDNTDVVTDQNGNLALVGMRRIALEHLTGLDN